MAGDDFPIFKKNIFKKNMISGLGKPSLKSSQEIPLGGFKSWAIPLAQTSIRKT